MLKTITSAICDFYYGLPSGKLISIIYSKRATRIDRIIDEPYM